MINRDNITEILTSLDPDQVQEAVNSNKPYLHIELSVFNGGYNTTVEAKEYDPLDEEDALNVGDLYLCVEGFLGLVGDLGLGYDLGLE